MYTRPWAPFKGLNVPNCHVYTTCGAVSTQPWVASSLRAGIPASHQCVWSAEGTRSRPAAGTRFTGGRRGGSRSSRASGSPVPCPGETLSKFRLNPTARNRMVSPAAVRLLGILSAPRPTGRPAVETATKRFCFGTSGLSPPPPEGQVRREDEAGRCGARKRGGPRKPITR